MIHELTSWRRRVLSIKKSRCVKVANNDGVLVGKTVGSSDDGVSD